MQLLKHFFNISLVAVLGATPVHAAQTLAQCLEQGKAQYDAQNYNAAAGTFSACVKLDTSSVDAHLSLAGVLLTQEDLKGAQTQFEEALQHMQRNSPYWSYTYSMLGDIALKQKENKKALSLYAKSLTYNAANVNSLIGKGVILEAQGDKQSAAEAYTAALAVEPLNVIARKRLIRLEPDYMTDEEILTALKQRYAVKPEQKELTEKNRALFEKIHWAEEHKGVDYLKNKYGKNTKEYIITLNQGTDFARDLLTLNGYNTLQKSIGQDAVTVFQRMNLPIQEVFALRNKEGKPVFTKESTLTDEGYVVYTHALAGKKEFLLPNQAVPPTPAQMKKANQRAKNLLSKGYAEISRSELKMVETQTLCSEETLKDKLGVVYLPVTKERHRFFVHTKDASDLKNVPYFYVMQARHKRNPKVEVPKNELVEYYKFYGYTICLSDGNLTLEETAAK